MHKHFIVEKLRPIYDPDEFRAFCLKAGAKTLFDNIWKGMTSERHSENRMAMNKKLTMSVIYTLCHGLSQRTNHLQRDFTSQLRLTGTSERAINAARNLGVTTTSRTGMRDSKKKKTENISKTNAAISEALEKGYLIVCIIDDYHHYHAIRRPDSEQTSSGADMCTTVIRIFPSIRALPRNNVSNAHNPEGVTNNHLMATICSDESLSRLSDSFASVMPDWIRTTFFDAAMERVRLSAHMYQQSDGARTMRSLDNLYLLDFIELSLKGTSGFQKALDNLLETTMADYMEQYFVLIPGDWPAQFFMRKIIYNTITNQNNGQDCDSSSMNRDLLTSLIPILGPLHVGLNAIEDVFLTFRSFFAEMYSIIFPGKKPLAEKPKPWRIMLVLELVYGGWSKIRETILLKFKDCKDVTFATITNLLDNYLPLVLNIYGIILRTNNFKQFLNAMIQVWVMFMCFHRRHYDKVPLIWISNVIYWSLCFPELYQIFSKYISVTDEYGVENTHSIIRSKTKCHDSVQQIIEKAKSIFYDKKNLQNFQSNFEPPKNYTFSHSNMDKLKGKAANILIDKFKEVASVTSEELDTKEKLTKVLGTYSTYMLPLGYHSSSPPDDTSRCDMPGCQYYKRDTIPWKIFHGCWHSFHLICLNGKKFCPICKSHLRKEANHLGQKAKDGIFSDHASTNTQQDGNDDDSDTADDDNISDGSCGFDPAKLNELDNLNITTPGLAKSSTRVSPASQATEKQSHCKKCGHIVKGHKRPTNQPPKMSIVS